MTRELHFRIIGQEGRIPEEDRTRRQFRTQSVGTLPGAWQRLEWCEDNWHENYQGAPVDGSVWSGGDSFYRVLRGGSWLNVPEVLRSAYRNGAPPDNRNFLIGFRVGRTL